MRCCKAALRNPASPEVANSSTASWMSGGTRTSAAAPLCKPRSTAACRNGSLRPCAILTAVEKLRPPAPASAATDSSSRTPDSSAAEAPAASRSNLTGSGSGQVSAATRNHSSSPSASSIRSRMLRSRSDGDSPSVSSSCSRTFASGSPSKRTKASSHRSGLRRNLPSARRIAFRRTPADEERSAWRINPLGRASKPSNVQRAWSLPSGSASSTASSRRPRPSPRSFRVTSSCWAAKRCQEFRDPSNPTSFSALALSSRGVAYGSPPRGVTRQMRPRSEPS